MKVPGPGVYLKDELDLGSLMKDVLGLVSDGSCGACAFFVGVVKKRGRGPVDVEMLLMESYREHADKALNRICEEVRAEYGLAFVGVWHLVGEFKLGEPVVVVAAAGEGREEVFAGLRRAVERYKREPALFKKEVYVDGSSSWIEGA
ncbi:MAG: molybdenum cofactor biosynthesis protein MoaE [Candidatus Caldarchaeum sp.]|uniref:Molybdenum cofactor biosynthesis protein MoaE n=1 Tax=Caldiarchaeum subterraneum TaxID=311458 RepID=A0A7J3VTK3_CALS0